GGIGNAIRLYQGSLVTFTNVYIVAGFTNGTFASGANYIMTNQAGEGFMLRVDSRIGDIIGKPIPPFAWRITAPMGYFLGTTVPDRSSGHQLFPTRYADIVTNAPSPATGAISLTGGNPTL